MKQCSKCKQWKSKNEFNKSSRNKDNLQYKCKECEKKRYRNNTEYRKKYNKEYYK